MNIAWWRTAVIYQIYPRSFADGNGDGMGDLLGITANLDYLAGLGVDALWLSPFYPSPQLDAGYDVSDYCDVDPLFGTLAEFDALLAGAHDRGLRVIIDLVPNHSSWDHVDFKAALAAGPGSPERDKYLFRNGKGPDGALPPTNWSGPTGSKWTRVTEADGSPGQWYLHIFDTFQPDWNWENPIVQDDFDEVLRFWLDRGVDGFRVDVSHGMVKDPRYQDWLGSGSGVIETADPATRPPMWDQDGVHDIYVRWRKVLDSYEGDRIMAAEAWLSPDRLARYIRPGEMHQAFNFPYLVAPWRAADLRHTIETTAAANAAVGGPTTWVLSNHDVVRHATRLGYGPDIVLEQGRGVGPADPQPDEELGLTRARAATLLMLALPGSAYLYQGEELGLPEAIDIPDDKRQDPNWIRSDHAVLGRDGCRVPLPWAADEPAFGFGSQVETWLPQPEKYATYAVDQQVGVEGSTLELYRKALATRAEHRLGLGTLAWVDGIPAEVVAYTNQDVLVAANTSDSPVEMPEGFGDSVKDFQPLICSTAGQRDDLDAGTLILPANTTCWWLRP